MIEMKKYKLGEIGRIITGKTPSTNNLENFENGHIPFYTPEDIARGFMMKGENSRFITEVGFEEIRNNTVSGESVMVGCIGSDMGNVAYTNEICATNQQINTITKFKDFVSPLYVYYLLSTMKSVFRQLAGSTTTPILTKSVFENIAINLPPLPIQQKVASVLSSLDRKIALNKQINQNLEALARQLYDYWFVQFDFPNEDGKPYKSSGGKMVYNPILKREIPEGWEIVTLSSYISKNNTGDWGKDEYFEKCIQVGCVRGADIVTLCNLPTRYIKNNPSKLLQPLDLVIEISGGSPTQATGRSAFITEGVINRNGGAISCSNFCHAFTMKNIKKAPYFFYLWRTFYENDIMFNYEGKTSGLKNFMTDTFLANVWYDVPDNLTNIFYEKIIAIFTQIDSNIAENLSLTKQRDELLPLLMNGQVNFDLSDD